MRLKLRFPLRLRIRIPDKYRGDLSDVAMYLGRQYKLAKTDKQRYKVVESLLCIGASTDAISRSVFLYPYFEEEVGEKFPILWGRE